MSKVSVSQYYLGTPTSLWHLVGDPAGLSSWHPAIVQSPLSPDGRVRTCTLADGGEVVEEILEHDDSARRYSYRIVSSPLPMENYVSTLRVEPNAGGSTVTWESEFEPVGIEPVQLEGMIRGLYEAGLAALRERVAG